MSRFGCSSSRNLGLGGVLPPSSTWAQRTLLIKLNPFPSIELHSICCAHLEAIKVVSATDIRLPSCFCQRTRARVCAAPGLAKTLLSFSFSVLTGSVCNAAGADQAGANTAAFTAHAHNRHSSMYTTRRAGKVATQARKRAGGTKAETPNTMRCKDGVVVAWRHGCSGPYG